MTSTEYDKVMMVNLLALVMLSYYRSNNWQCDHCPGGSARLFSKFMDDLALFVYVPKCEIQQSFNFPL